MAQLNMVEALNLALKQEMARDKNVIVIGEDVGKDGGVFRVTEGLFEKFGDSRVFDTPLAESGIVGSAIGLAVNGFKPVVEIQFDGFTYLAFDQIISHLARIRTRSRGRFSCPIVIRFPFSGGIHAPEHHSESPEAFYAHIPGIKVVIPSSPSDAKGLLVAAIRDQDPVIFMEPKKIYRSMKEEVPETDYFVPIGKAKIIVEGGHVTLISWGAMVIKCIEAANELAKKGISVELIDLRTLSPLDKDAVISSVKKTGRCVVVHEAPKTCGFGAEIVALINENAFLNLQAPILRVTGFDTPMPLYKLEEYYLPNSARIIEAVNKVMNF